MRIQSFAALAFAFALPAVATAAQVGAGGGGYDVNKDLKNLGSPAHDLAIVLEGTEQITQTMDGYAGGSSSTIPGAFSSRTEAVVNGNTVIHWQYFDDGTNYQIDRNQTIHVGYTTYDHNSKVLDIYWTDQNGNRIRGSVVYDVKAEVTYGSRFGWVLENAYAEQATVGNIRYAVLPSPTTLPGLGRDNDELTAALHSVDGNFTLSAGESTTIELPIVPPPGSAVVLVYEVTGEGSDAVVTNYVQTVVRGGKP